MVTEVVAALIWNGDRFMICQRPAHKARGLVWAFVGGKVVVHEYPDVTVRLSLFNAVITDGVPQMLEHNDIRWITPAEIPQYDFCPADEEILDKIMKVQQ